MNILLLLLLCGGNNGTGNAGREDNRCCDNDVISRRNEPECGCGMDNNFGGMDGRFDGRHDSRMDTRPFMTFQGGTCGCEDNNAPQSVIN